MGTLTKRTERVLSDAAEKVARAEEAARLYEAQLLEATSAKRRLEEENEKLRTSILNMALQNASVDLRREHVQLRQTLDSYQTKIDQMREISLLSAKVVDRLMVYTLQCDGVYYSRIKTKQGRQYVEYKLQIETDIRGTLVLWHRYSTFLNLAATLKAKNPSSEHDIPELQTQSLTGFFSDQLIIDRIAKLNEFLVVTRTRACTSARASAWTARLASAPLGRVSRHSRPVCATVCSCPRRLARRRFRWTRISSGCSSCWWWCRCKGVRRRRWRERGRRRLKKRDGQVVVYYRKKAGREGAVKTVGKAGPCVQGVRRARWINKAQVSDTRTRARLNATLFFTRCRLRPRALTKLMQISTRGQSRKLEGKKRRAGTQPALRAGSCCWKLSSKLRLKVLGFS
uniref:PX domain-containing protein n=1 Tax=Hyaloperonospora arabidopsidis (strain Emoy2) TaxID=559515 RepID=M4B527_HYAAE